VFRRRSRTNHPTYDEALHQWRRHQLLHSLINRRRHEIVPVNPDVARTLRRDGYLIEDGYPGGWKVTAQGVAAHARWGIDGPGPFRYPS
jgi:hypothetical protein